MAATGGPNLCIRRYRARDHGRLLQAVDFPGPEPPEPRLGSDAEEHGPALGAQVMRNEFLKIS